MDAFRVEHLVGVLDSGAANGTRRLHHLHQQVRTRLAHAHVVARQDDVVLGRVEAHHALILRIIGVGRGCRRRHAQLSTGCSATLLGAVLVLEHVPAELDAAHLAAQRLAHVHERLRVHTAMQKLRIVSLGFGRVRQRMVLE